MIIYIGFSYRIFCFGGGGGTAKMVMVVVVCVSMPMHVLACVPSRGVLGFLDDLRLFL